MAEPTTTFNLEVENDNVKELEKLARALLEKEPESGDTALLCLYFTSLFQYAIEGLPKNVEFRKWCLDDLYFQEFTQTTKKYTLKGQANWLLGGDDCHHVNLDVEKNELLFRYSFKFISKAGRQNLYVGRTNTRWTISVTDRIHPLEPKR